MLALPNVGVCPLPLLLTMRVGEVSSHKTSNTAQSQYRPRRSSPVASQKKQRDRQQNLPRGPCLSHGRRVGDYSEMMLHTDHGFVRVDEAIQ